MLYRIRKSFCILSLAFLSTLFIVNAKTVSKDNDNPLISSSSSINVNSNFKTKSKSINSFFLPFSFNPLKLLKKQVTVPTLTLTPKSMTYATIYPITIHRSKQYHLSFVPPSASPKSSTNPSTTTPMSTTRTKKQSLPHKNLIALAAILFVISAALAAAETAITTLWPWKVRELAEKEGSKSPFSILEKDLTRFLTTILVSTTSATVFSTAIATDLAGDFFGPSSVAYVTAILTVVFLFLGEILPKSLAVHAPTKVARIMVPVINMISIIVYPVGKSLAWASTHILRMLKLPMENDNTVSEEELRLIVAGADRSGAIEKYESQIIHNVLDLEDTDVSEVMCPRVDMVAIGVKNSLVDLLQLEKDSHYSRMPVYDGTVDNIVGVAMTKSLLRFLSHDQTGSNSENNVLNQTKVLDIMDPAFFVPESMSVWVALEEMRKRRLHMAVVVDEYGGTAGLVTLEDILEEVVGEIYDEDDDVEADKTQLRKGTNGEMMIEGQAELEKVGDALNLHLDEDDLDDYGTISGFLCAKMGGIPEINDCLVFRKVKFTVDDADDRRIKSVKAETLSTEQYEQLVMDTDKIKGNERNNGITTFSPAGDDGDMSMNATNVGGDKKDDQNKNNNYSSSKKIMNSYRKDSIELDGSSSTTFFVQRQNANEFDDDQQQ